ncbi:MAG: hypothetical protein JST49_06910 [Bacteroidetes bacterium]|nr:hypothetical protein [Bacteroidota bacterium]
MTDRRWLIILAICIVLIVVFIVFHTPKTVVYNNTIANTFVIETVDNSITDNQVKVGQVNGNANTIGTENKVENQIA